MLSHLSPKESFGNHLEVYSKVDFLILLAMLMLSADTVLFGTNANSFFINIKYVFISSLILVYFKQGLSSITRRSPTALVLALMTLLLASTAFLCGDLRGGYVLRFILILSAFCYTSNTPKRKFMLMFSDAVFFIALYSLVCHILNQFVPSLFSFFPIVTNTSGLEFRNLFFCNIPINYSVDRLWGPFSEPGVFQIMLNLAMLFDICMKKDLNYLRIGVFVVAILLSKSTAGYFTMALVFIQLLSSNTGGSRSRSRAIALLLFGVAAVVLSQFTDLLSTEGDVFGKLQDTQRNSTAARIASITCNIEMFKMSPIWGVGLTAADELFPVLANAAVGVFTGSNTNQLLFQFASMGVFYGLLWSIGVAKFFFSMGRSSIIGKIVLFLIFILLCAGENLNWSILFYLFIFYGYQN